MQGGACEKILHGRRRVLQSELNIIFYPFDDLTHKKKRAKLSEERNVPHFFWTLQKS